MSPSLPLGCTSRALVHAPWIINPGKCPECGMDLLPEGMMSSPLHMVIMAAAMLAAMATAMMLMR